jgi:hypothetical protein
MRSVHTGFSTLIILLLVTTCGSQNRAVTGNSIFLCDETHVIHYANINDPAEKPRFASTSALQKLPDQDRLEIIDIMPLDTHMLLVITRQHGIYKIVNLGAENEYTLRIDSGLPPEVVYPFDHPFETKPVISHSISPDNTRIALLFSNGLYLSLNGGYSFGKAELRGMKEVNEPLAVAWHPYNKNLILVGTSFNGIYYSTDMGNSVTNLATGLPGEPVRRPFLLEEVRSLCFGADQDTFFAGLGNGGGVLRGSITGERVWKLDDSRLYTYPDGDFYMAENLNYLKGNLILFTDRQDNRRIFTFQAAGYPENLPPLLSEYILHSRHLISATLDGGHAAFAPHYRPAREFTPDPRALHKHALYISYTFTQRRNYKRLINLLSLLKLNAVIINLKDDYGSVRVPTDDPVLNSVPEAVDPYLDVVDTIKRLKQDGIYVIGRMVSFKDEHLYKYQNYKYAVKDTATHVFLKGPEMWVDPYSEFVWDYNIRAARAVEKAGVDEIQFDYIRFPDIRNRKDTRKYDFQKPNQIMREALVSFLKKARENLSVPISIDLFGYNAISKMGNWIGQDVTELSRYVDVVSPMFYPSHYGGSYAADYGDKRVHYIIYLSCKRTKELIGGAQLRPYIQAFYYKENTDNYGIDYIGWELEGLKQAGLEDFIFWNNLHEYETLIRGMQKYLGTPDSALTAEILADLPRKLPFSSVLEKEAGRGSHSN